MFCGVDCLGMTDLRVIMGEVECKTEFSVRFVCLVRSDSWSLLS